MWRDVHLWLVLVPSLVVGALVGGLVVLVAGVPSSTAGWVGVGLVAAIVVLVAFVTLAMGVNTARAFSRGAAESDERRGRSYEATGRAAGAMVGRGLRGLRRGGRRNPTRPPAIDVASSERPSAPPSAEPDPPSTAPSRPAADPSAAPTPKATTPSDRDDERPPVTVDAAARSIGSMVGRRLAERRRRS